MPEASAYERGRAAGDAALRRALLEVAGDLLAREGPEGLRVRRLAAAAGCSTAVLYRLFGGKHDIVAALYRDGFDRLRQRLEAVAAADPAARLAGLARAYRAQALADPSAYAVMFGRPVPEFTPSAEDAEHGRDSLAVLVDAVAEAQAAGGLRADEDAASVARVLWAAAHGAVSLELSGHLEGDEAAQTFSSLTAAAAARFAG